MTPEEVKQFKAFVAQGYYPKTRVSRKSIEKRRVQLYQRLKKDLPDGAKWVHNHLYEVDVPRGPDPTLGQEEVLVLHHDV